MRSVFVTGGTGFMGRGLIMELVRRENRRGGSAWSHSRRWSGR